MCLYNVPSRDTIKSPPSCSQTLELEVNWFPWTRPFVCFSPSAWEHVLVNRSCSSAASSRRQISSVIERDGRSEREGGGALTREGERIRALWRASEKYVTRLLRDLREMMTLHVIMWPMLVRLKRLQCRGKIFSAFMGHPSKDLYFVL